MSWVSQDKKLQVFDRTLNAGLFLVTTALLAAVYFLAFRPLDAQFQAAYQESENLDALAQRNTEISKKHRDLEERLATCRKQTNELWQRIPSSPHESDFLAQVSQLAEK